MTAVSPSAESSDRNFKRVRPSAAFLLVCGAAVVLLSMLAQAERATVQITSYSKLREMQSTGLISVPAGEGLSFTRPKGDLATLHGDLFPTGARLFFQALTVLGAAIAVASGLILFLTRSRKISPAIPAAR